MPTIVKAALLTIVLITIPVNSAKAFDCPTGDIYGDCRIDIQDLKAFGEHWLDAVCSEESCGNFDGVTGVSFGDFTVLMNNWLEAEYPLVINEFMAKNDDFILDPAGDDDDWIELYNYEDVPVDIGGMYVTDEPGNQIEWWQIPDTSPEETTIPPGGFLLLWADGEPGQGVLHVDFSLSADGEEIGLFDPEGNPVDSLSFDPQNSNESYGRFPDGGTGWQVFTLGTTPPSPRASNGSALVDIIINEIMYHPSTENDLEEYIELYNNGAGPVNLMGWRFSDGVNFTFGNVTIESGQYLVVAADVATFSSKYPGVTNVVGGWIGKLSNKSEDIELIDEVGVIMDSLDYADEGDWAERLLGPLDYNQRGWEWSDAHDGGGKSLELINPDMPNKYGQNWAASTTVQGTPGVVNSLNDSDIGPLILDVKHRPIIPRSSDTVTVTAEVIDELSSGISVTLYHRVDSSVYSQNTYPHHDPCDFTTVTMLDDGLSGDGEIGDNVYGGQIPAQSDEAIVEFFIKVSDSGANIRTYPAPSDIDGTPEQVTNLLYQVNDSYDREVKWLPGSQRIYYFIMTNDENLRLKDIGDDEGGESESNAQMNATFVSHDGVDIKARYNVGIRNRGKSSRVGPPNNFRVNFVHERSWEDATAININFKYSHSQIMGSAVFRMAGLAGPEVIPIQLRVNGDDLSESGSRMYGTYAHLEAFGSEFVENHFPDDDDGNLYKAQIWCQECTPTQWIAGLYYEGTDPCNYVAAGYSKDTNEEENDWSDLINLTNVLDNSPDITYVEDVNTVVNVDQWVRWFAVHNLIGNNETNLGNGRGDDYRLFMGMNDKRAVLVQHDLDTVLGLGSSPNPTDDSIFRAADPVHLPIIERFLEHPDFVPRYYAVLKELTETTFSPEQMDPLVDQTLGGFVPQLTINAIKQFVVDRVANVLTQIPLELTTTSSLSTSGGFYRTITNSGDVFGYADAINTRSVTVNGLPATWTAFGAQYSFDIATSGLTLNPGINRLKVQAFADPNGTGEELDHEFIDIWYDTASETTFAGGTLASNTLFDLVSSPWRVTGSITIPAGITLTIEPGTSVYFNNLTGITINGRLVAEGTEYQRIRLTRVPGTGAVWNGLIFQNTLEDSRLSYLDMSYGDGRGNSILIEYSQVLLNNVSWPGSTQRALELLHPSLIARNCVFEGIDGEVIHGEYIENSEYLILESNLFQRGHTGGDIVDFSGAERPGPVFQVMNNIFMGGPDDGIDLDGTDAHIEGNIFMDFHKETTRNTTSNGVATGLPQSGGLNRTDATIVRNVFYGNDHGLLLKEEAYGTIVNNVFVGSDLAAIQFHEVGGTEVYGPADGAYIDGNIFLDNPELFKHQYSSDPCLWTPPTIEVNRSIIDSEKHSLGTGNIDVDPAFIDDDSDFHLRETSAAIDTGPNLRDMGVYVPAGATVAGVPDEMTRHTDATLTVDGPGISHYIYRVNDNGAWMDGWSSEQTIGTDISLSSLQDGHTYTVYTRGRNIDEIWPGEANGNASETWTVDITHWLLLINEVLADPNSTPNDLIELYYDGPSALDMADMSITDNPAYPRKYVFGPGTTINPGEYMVLVADPNTASGHLGFALDADGERVYLYDKLSNGGAVVDSVVFGEQLLDLSIGRIGREHKWTLTKPSFGSANVSEPLDNPYKLKINEWLANGEVLFADDFIEIYNPGKQPVDLGGLYLTDDPVAEPDKHRIWPLTFVEGSEYFVFRADDDPSEGSNHAHFRLSADQEMIGLYDPGLNEIDKVTYYTQTTDVSQGRSPDGGSNFAFFTFPTPGIMNITDTVDVTITTENLFPIDAVWSYYQSGAAPGTWSDVGFDDSGWPTGAALLYVEGSSLPGPKNTPLILGKKTYYFRRHFTIDGDPNLIDDLSVSAIIDDGAVFHINGVEALRHGVEEGITVTYNTLANRTIDNAGIENFSLPTDTLVQGDNVIAVEVHQTDPGSSDIVFGMSLDSLDITTTIITEANPYVEEEKVLNSLRITEMMYHSDVHSDLEYVEFQNISSEEIDITGVHFTDGIDYTFGAVTLDPNEYVVIACDEGLFETAYPGVDAIGQYTGKLNNAGEDIVLKLASPHKAAILRFDYNNTWYPSTDGGGESLEIIDPAAYPATWDDKESWQGAAPSPGGP